MVHPVPSDTDTTKTNETSDPAAAVTTDELVLNDSADANTQDSGKTQESTNGSNTLSSSTPTEEETKTTQPDSATSEQTSIQQFGDEKHSTSILEINRVYEPVTDNNDTTTDP